MSKSLTKNASAKFVQGRKKGDIGEDPSMHACMMIGWY